MTSDKRTERALSTWLEQTAPPRLPERVLDATFERTRRSKQHVGWRGLLWRLRVPRIAPALGGTAVVVVAGALMIGLASLSGVGGPPPPPVGFVGTWENDQDADGGHQTMEVISLPSGSYGVTIRDDIASVCGRVPSTMTGVAEATDPNTFVIAQPDYVCDDGSQSQALGGPPLEEQLRNLVFVYDPGRDELDDSFGAVWTRVATGPDATPPASEGTPGPTPTEEPSSTPAPDDGQPVVFAGTWINDQDGDGSHQTMEVIELPDGTYDVTIRDDLASVCGGAPSTMTGVAVVRSPRMIVIEQPEFVCDDGSQPEALSGRPLEEQLQNLAFISYPGSDVLQDSFGLVWSRLK